MHAFRQSSYTPAKGGPLTVTEEKKIDALEQWCLIMFCNIKWNDFVTNEEVRGELRVVSVLNCEEEAPELFRQVAKSDQAKETRLAIAMSTPSQWKIPPGRQQNSGLLIISKDLKDVSIPDATDMAKDRGLWKRVITAQVHI